MPTYRKRGGSGRKTRTTPKAKPTPSRSQKKVGTSGRKANKRPSKSYRIGKPKGPAGRRFKAR